VDPFLLITPMSVLLVSLAGHRWGPAVGGRLAAVPLTSGPLVLVVAIAHGPAAARLLATGVLAGMPTVVVFCVAYVRLARRNSWPVCVSIAFAVTAVSAGVLSVLPAPATVSAAMVGVSALLARRLPRSDQRSARPGWELPVRIILTTVLVQGLSALAPLVGARLAGVLATFPALACVLAAMAHRRSGAGAATELLRGLLGGLLPTVGFFSALIVLLGQMAT
jgi:hypothetical protein